MGSRLFLNYLINCNIIINKKQQFFDLMEGTERVAPKYV